ncbi:unnamed protein product [Sphenostylis stenocarpa]|uniref:Uncharacterized protein n=1 Tax=Sphenostylis stenocarpa TaxID=92480 RepID=A0AA86VVM9_9FABA|nr:unnamed protein product [Sphenostylis stenocarpa]
MQMLQMVRLEQIVAVKWVSAMGLHCGLCKSFNLPNEPVKNLSKYMKRTGPFSKTTPLTFCK